MRCSWRLRVIFMDEEIFDLDGAGEGTSDPCVPSKGMQVDFCKVYF